MLAFTARCAPSGAGPVRHEPIDFTDREAFEDHMMTVHGKRKPFAGAPIPYVDSRNAPGWGKGGILPPHPHKPPRRTAGGLDKVTERIAAGDYTWPSGYRWKDDAPAAEAVPA